MKRWKTQAPRMVRERNPKCPRCAGAPIMYRILAHDESRKTMDKHWLWYCRNCSYSQPCEVDE